MKIKEKQFTGGVAEASSVYNTASAIQASNAFLVGSKKFWHSGRDANGKGDVAFSYPHLIWYKFAKADAFIPARLSFKARLQSGCDPAGCGATKYQFIASNDGNCNQYSAWKVLCEDLSGRNFSPVNEVKYCEVKRSDLQKYSCVGISVLGSSWTKTDEVSVTAIRMWEYVI